MKKSLIIFTLLSSSLTGSVVPAMARGEDFFVGSLLGGVIGMMVGRDQIAPRYHRPPPRRYYYMTPEQRAYNIDIQRRLNYLGYDAGYLDGVLGPRSRAAIKSFQKEAGFPVTGRLDPQQTSTLFSVVFENNVLNRSHSPGEQEKVVEDLGTSEETAAEEASSETLNGELTAAQDTSLIKPLTAANTNLTFKNGAPAFFGIVLGQSYESAQQILAQNGFDICNGTGEIVTCSKQQNDVTKSFRLARSMSEAGQPIYMMDSDTELVVDVDKSVITDKLAESYPELTAAPNMIISDNANCALKMARMSEVETFLDRLEVARNNSDEAPSDWLKGTVDACDVFYKANIGEITGGYDVRVVMFKSSYVQQAFSSIEDQKMDKVSNALKF
nr:peptidoglycan-binding domain-containing protein [uncultured Cohaesibacter sp.]